MPVSALSLKLPARAQIRFGSVVLLVAASLLFAEMSQAGEPAVSPDRPRESTAAAGADDAAGEQRPSANTGVAITAMFDKQGRGRVVVQGLAAEDLSALASAKPDREAWARLFAVCVVSADGGEPLPMLGSYRVEDDRLLFQPRFPFQPGLTYRATFVPAALPRAIGTAAGRVTYEFSIPKPPAGAPAVVEQVYPTRSTLPENLLKFYIHFSAPMSRGEAYDRIRLIDAAADKPVEYPFLELDEELWDQSGTRFTLLFDPGRIKQGLKPREDVGTSLEAGKSYTIVIDREWLDAAGRPLKDAYRKSFQVVGPDEVQPDPKRWKLAVPSAGTTGPLAVRFDEPLDHAMLQRVLSIENRAGARVGGRIEVAEEETLWRFFPGGAWDAGRYSLVVDTTLEDRAGNSIGRPFEVDLLEPVQQRITTEQIRLPFQIEHPSAP